MDVMVFFSSSYVMYISIHDQLIALNDGHGSLRVSRQTELPLNILS